MSLTRGNTKIIDLYCRISRDYDGDGGYRSVDDQEDDGRATVAEHERDGWRVGRVFKDPAKSAWNPKVVRPDWEELMTRLEAGQSHGVWVYDLTRFTRKPIEGERLIALAERGVIVVSEDSNYDLATADGKKQFRDAMTAAAFESDKTSQRVTRGKRKKAARGKSNASWRGFGLPGYAPKPEDWSPGEPRELVSAEQVAVERDTVRDLARRLLAGGPGNSLDALTRELNARGIRSVIGNPWTPQAVRQMLKRPSLAGLVEYKDEIIPGKTLPGEPVLDRETWDAVQALFASRRRGRTPAVYLLSGLAFCGMCGAPLYGRPRSNVRPYSDGEPARQYWCQLRPDGTGCGRLAIDQRYADDAVKRAVIRLLTDPQHAERLARKAEKVRARRSKLHAEITEAEALGRAMAEKLGRGEMRPDRYDALEAGLDARLARLRSQLDDAEGADADGSPDDDVARVWAEAEATGNLVIRRRMVKRAFPRLAIRPATSRGQAALTADRFDWEGRSLVLSDDRPVLPLPKHEDGPRSGG